MIAIPSTLSGGEYNSGTLVTDTRRKLKQIFNHPMMMPRTIILDPAITKYTPEKLWLGSGTRAMDHGIEAVCSIRGNALVDTRLSAAACAILHDGLLRTRENPDDEAARHELPVGLLDVGVRIAGEGADGRKPCHRTRAGGHLRRTALFLHGGDDAERAALQSAGHRTSTEADLGRARFA